MVSPCRPGMDAILPWLVDLFGGPQSHTGRFVIIVEDTHDQTSPAKALYRLSLDLLAYARRDDLIGQRICKAVNRNLHSALYGTMRW